MARTVASVRRKLNYSRRRRSVIPKAIATRTQTPKPAGFTLGYLGFPKMLKVKQRYVGAPVQLNCIGGAFSTYVWRANSVYDPDFTGTGAQPLYTDTLFGIYEHAVVVGSRIRLQIQFAQGTVGPCIGCLWTDSNSATTAASISHVSEYGKNPTINFGGPNDSGKTFFHKKWSAKKTFGGSVLSNPSLQCTDSANPTEETYYKFSFNTVDSSTVTIYITAIQEFLVVYKELKEIARS